MPLLVGAAGTLMFGIMALTHLEQLEAIGTDIGSRNVNDYLDLSIIDQLKQEGYFAQLEKAYPVK